jgi:hypothetical protein
MKALLNETYGGRSYIMEFPFFDLKVFSKLWGLFFYVEGAGWFSKGCLG